MYQFPTRTIISLIVLLAVTVACGGASAPQTSPPAPTEESVTEESIDSLTKEAVESAATESPSPEPAEPLGSSPQSPVPLDGILVTPEWEVQALEMLSGDEALTKLEEVSSSNGPPEEADSEYADLEYVLLRLRVKYLGANESIYVYDRIFRTTIGDGEFYDWVSFLDVEAPAPELEADLTPGAETEGWIVVHAPKDGTAVLLVLWPYISYENNSAVYSEATTKWYISLEE